jgi:hypothetical protein
MAGYSGTPLIQKLGLRETMRAALLAAPPGYTRILGPLPEGLAPSTRLGRNLDWVQLFVTRRADLEKRFPSARDALAPAGMLWVSWPKGQAKARVPTDLDETQVREVGLAAGLVDVKVCAVDETWSGLKFVRRVRDR